jgi:Na+/H+ antiporter NhaD/arsenite permease-like protein
VELEVIYVIWYAAGLYIFSLGTIFLTFIFDVIARDDWRKEYGKIQGPRPNECLRSRWMQILVVIIIQFVVMGGVLFFFLLPYFRSTGNTIPNDMVVSQLSMIAAWITFFAVNIPWLLYLLGSELRHHRKLGS